jgi:chemotaxis protein methyltransferase CheR
VEIGDAAARTLAALLEARTGQQLAPGRQWRIGTALEPLMRERGFPSLDALVAAIVSGLKPGLADEAIEALLNNETFFFRDRQSFEQLLGPVLRRLEMARSPERRLAIWCAGCSTGQEAYSLAIALAEQKARWDGWRIDIAATDVSGGAIAHAISGVYSQFEVQRGLSVLQMLRWFKEYPGAAWKIDDSLRRSVRFERRALADASPVPGRFDIVLCRNVLLYFTPAARRAAFARLAEAAADDAVLMLGAGETLSGDTDAFAPDEECRGLYRRVPRLQALARAS